MLQADALEGDVAARKEVNEQRAELAGYVYDQLTRLIASDEKGENPCDWIWQGKPIPIENERALQGRLSRICDEVFSKTPEIWNELVNRKSPSPSAVHGLKKLLEAMLEHGEKPRLGIEGTPAEYGLYASVLEATGMHREEEGTWAFRAPREEKQGCRAVWEAIADLLRNAEGQRVSVQAFYDTLTGAPYGVREGLLPILLFAFYQHAGDEIALYEDGSFVHDPGYAEIERFLNTPGKFAFQHVSIGGTRAEVLRQLAPLVGLSEASSEPLPFVIQLLKAVRGLPPYVRKTARLSDEALAVRETLHRATEPATLLFEELPEACGVPSFLGSTEPQAEHAAAFVSRLQEALRELGRAYDDLIGDIEQQIAQAFRLQARDAEERRSELAERTQVLLPHATETSLKSFCVRATDEILDTQGWYETLAALLAKRPPAQWVDKNRETFKSNLAEVAQRFRQREPLYFDTPQRPEAERGSTLGVGSTDESEEPAPVQGNGKAAPTAKIRRIRLSITAQDEPEQEAVISIRVENEARIDEIAERVENVLVSEESESSIDVKLAAVSKVGQSLLAVREDSFSLEETAWARSPATSSPSAAERTVPRWLFTCAIRSAGSARSAK